MWFVFWLFFLLAQVSNAQDASGFTSLSCGAPRGTSFREEGTDINYISDASFIDTGVGRSIKSSHQSILEKHKWYLRTFPHGIRNCYTLNLTTGDRYLIRASFLHGGYDGHPSTRFQLHLGPNLWDNVSTTTETEERAVEIIHLMTTTRLQICLVKTGESVPFISALELRRLNIKAYNTSRGSLQTVFRDDVGSTSGRSLRYSANVLEQDVYDRVWTPYIHLENWSTISTNNSVFTKGEFQPPEIAMATASFPTDPAAPMDILINGVHPTSRLYAVFHFAEIKELNSSERREFHIMYNGRIIYKPFKPRSFAIFSISEDTEVGPDANGQSKFSLQRTERATLPPLLNAMEVFVINFLPQKETDAKEAYAMMNIKAIYNLNKIDWEGDPCVPPEYKWSNVGCTNGSSQAPKILHLNLSDHGLTGKIQDFISNLTNLQVLDLSRNKLSGSVPEFLSRMENLKHINLSWNDLNGSIPIGILDKMRMGLVSLSLEGNRELCDSPSCSSNNKMKIIWIVVASVAASLLVITVVIILKRKRCPSPDGASLHPPNVSDSLIKYQYEELVQATANFSSTNLLGQGGFGYVHKGVLPNGTEVAVKHLKPGSGQGEREFYAEIDIFSRVHHKNLVTLLGYCINGSHRLLLVYELVANNTLEFHLHERGRPVLDWSRRMKIAMGTASVLSYLHEDCRPKVIHRDIKATNVLIDDSYEAKLADFGLAKACSDSDTHVSTRIMGTFGYMAPDYASSGKLDAKSDVFSFGVLLLELITGRRPLYKPLHDHDDYDNLSDWARPLMEQAIMDGNFDGLVDPRLENGFDIREMTRLIACASACIRYSAKHRPKMSQIVRALEGNLSLDDLTEGLLTPGHSPIYSLDKSSDYSSEECRQDLKKFKKMAVECSSQNPSTSSGITESQRIRFRTG